MTPQVATLTGVPNFDLIETPKTNLLILYENIFQCMRLVGLLRPCGEVDKAGNQLPHMLFK